MHTVKVIGMILLGIYLVFTGLAGLSGVNLPFVAQDLTQLIALGAGVLLLISTREFK